MFNIYDFVREPTLDKIKYIVNEFYKQGIILHNYTFMGISLLHIKQGPETMKYLLNKGINPNISGIYDLKPIHFQENYGTILLLLNAGAVSNPKCINDINPLFFQKDKKSIELLLKTNEIYFSRIFSRDKLKSWCPYTRMLIAGGYDYSQEYISVSPIFLQRNYDSLKCLLDHCYNNYITDFCFDLSFESILFKPYIDNKIIKLYTSYNYGDLYNTDHSNIINNTSLHVQYDPDNILALLESGANPKIKNRDGYNAFDYHLLRNNIGIANIIRNYSAAKTIQNSWRSFWFKKTYIPPKNYKIKKEFLDDFILLSPSECGVFPGGIDYQKALEDFNSHLQQHQQLHPL